MLGGARGPGRIPGVASAYYLYRTPNPDVLELVNDVGDSFRFDKGFAGHLAMMLADHESDPDMCHMVSDEWQGRAYGLEEDEEDGDSEDDD